MQVINRYIRHRRKIIAYNRKKHCITLVICITCISCIIYAYTLISLLIYVLRRFNAYMIYLRIASRKWIIERFTRLFFGYDCFLSDQMFCFDVNLLCLFMWVLFEISVVLYGFTIYFCYGYFRFYCDISILFLYD